MRDRNTQNRGFTLPEMLITMAIFGVVAGLAVPALIRMGAFTSSRVGDSARDVFMIMRAARQYAAANNVETAVIYNVLYENEDANDIFDAADQIPIVDSYAIARRLTPAEMAILNQQYDNVPFDDDDVVVVPIEELAGEFKVFEGGACILPDLFEIDTANANVSTTGLSPVFVLDPGVLDFDVVNGPLLLDPAVTGLMTPRFHYTKGRDDLSVDPTAAAASFADAFPAHVFMPSGEIFPIPDVQRATIRVGLRPSQLPTDRFYKEDTDVEYDPGIIPTDVEVIDVQCQNDPTDLALNDDTVPIFHDPDRVTRGDPTPSIDFSKPIENTVNISLYMPTGRVKIE